MRLGSIGSTCLVLLPLILACSSDPPELASGPDSGSAESGLEQSPPAGGNTDAGVSDATASGGSGALPSGLAGAGGASASGGAQSIATGGRRVSTGGVEDEPTGGRSGESTGGRSTGGSSTGGRSSSSGGESAGGASESTGGRSTGGSSNESLPPLEGGNNGWASRYWDCCKPHCGWAANVQGGNPIQSCDQQNQSMGGNYDAKNGCESGGSAFMCYDFAPWAVSDQLAYGFVAYNGARCGQCFQVQFDGSSHNGGQESGSGAIAGKQMVVQVINIGGIEQNQLDLLIPGGGVGAMNGCSTQWGTGDLGAQYGGFLTECQGGDRASCVLQKCESVFGQSGREDLMAGCRWFVEWFGAADNPNLRYKEISCPAAIVDRSGLS